MNFDEPKMFTVYNLSSMSVSDHDVLLLGGVWQKYLSHQTSMNYYPMTYILSESEATITRGIWSHIPLPQKGYIIPYTMRETHIPCEFLSWYIGHIPLLPHGISDNVVK